MEMVSTRVLCVSRLRPFALVDVDCVSENDGEFLESFEIGEPMEVSS
jgi:hypothetical protein